MLTSGGCPSSSSSASCSSRLAAGEGLATSMAAGEDSGSAWVSAGAERESPPSWLDGEPFTDVAGPQSPSLLASSGFSRRTSASSSQLIWIFRDLGFGACGVGSCCCRRCLWWPSVFRWASRSSRGPNPTRHTKQMNLWSLKWTWVSHQWFTIASWGPTRPHAPHSAKPFRRLRPIVWREENYSDTSDGSFQELVWQQPQTWPWCDLLLNGVWVACLCMDLLLFAFDPPGQPLRTAGGEVVMMYHPTLSFVLYLIETTWQHSCD